MGSFLGHIDEGIFFMLLAIWWMYRGFMDYIKADFDGKKVRSKLSYGVVLCSGSKVPVETIAKVLFPIAAFLGEVFSRGTSLLDENGNFRKLVNIQHMTIYSIFTIHGVFDLLSWYKVPLMKGLDFFSAFIAFMWYGVSFYFHSMDGRTPLETIVHLLPTIVMYGAAASALLEMWLEQKGIWPLLARSYFVFTLGTWFTHVSFVLYVHDRLPGGEPNTDWDRQDHRNVHFMIAAFGMHLNANMIFMALFYFAVYIAYRLKGQFGRTRCNHWRMVNKNGLINKHNCSEEYSLLTQGEDEDC